MSAWRYACAHPRHRAVVLFVAVNLVADLAGRLLEHVNGPSSGAARVGLARVLFHAGEVCYLAWPLGLAALAFAVFLEPHDVRPAVRAVAGLSVAFLGLLFVLYPAARGDARRGLYLGAELAALAAAAAAAVPWLRSRDRPTLTDASVLVFAFLQVGAVLHLRLPGWDAQRFFYGVAYTALVLLHVAGELWARQRSTV